MADQSKPSSGIIALSGFIAALFLFFTLVLSIYFLPIVIHQEMKQKVEDAPTLTFDSLRAQETLNLTGYSYADKDKGIVRIPISEALRLEAGYSWRAGLPIPASTMPTTGTQTTAAPTTASTPASTPARGGVPS